MVVGQNPQTLGLITISCLAFLPVRQFYKTHTSFICFSFKVFPSASSPKEETLRYDGDRSLSPCVPYHRRRLGTCQESAQCARIRIDASCAAGPLSDRLPWVAVSGMHALQRTNSHQLEGVGSIGGPAMRQSSFTILRRHACMTEVRLSVTADASPSRRKTWSYEVVAVLSA